MYAIIKTGGKQYRVKAGDSLRVEKLDQPLGAEFEISEVLYLENEGSSQVGTPLVPNAKIAVVVTMQSRSRKIIVFKKKRRNGYRKFNTHRQEFTELFVKSITGPNGAVMKTDASPKVVDVQKEREERLRERMRLTRAQKIDLSSKGGEAPSSSDEVSAVGNSEKTRRKTPVKGKKTPKSAKSASTSKAKSAKAGRSGKSGEKKKKTSKTGSAKKAKK